MGLYVDNIWIIRNAGSSRGRRWQTIGTQYRRHPASCRLQLSNVWAWSLRRHRSVRTLAPRGRRAPPDYGYRMERCSTHAAGDLGSRQSLANFHGLEDHAARPKDSLGPRLSSAATARSVGHGPRQSDAPDVHTSGQAIRRRPLSASLPISLLRAKLQVLPNASSAHGTRWLIPAIVSLSTSIMAEPSERIRLGLTRNC